MRKMKKEKNVNMYIRLKEGRNINDRKIRTAKDLFELYGDMAAVNDEGNPDISKQIGVIQQPLYCGFI